MTDLDKLEKLKCSCPSEDARQCFLAHHPECRRVSDDVESLYDEAIDEVCECSCHYDDEDALDILDGKEFK
jgi:hypothetical protein